MRGWAALFTVSGLVVAAVIACGQTQSVSCPADSGWVPSTTDPKCCAPPHNQFICPADAATDGPTCTVTLGGLFVDDAGVGQSFPLGCETNVTYCNQFYEGAPQNCFCEMAPLADGGQSPAWTCGI